jgi:GT2 family glycosyltransferase
MPDAITVGAIAINWNGSSDTLELLESLCLCQSSVLNIRVALIDNASCPDDVAKLKTGIARLPGALSVTLRENSVNIGVPAAYNQAIQLLGAKCDVYLRLDNDVTVNPLGLKSMVAALEEGRAHGVAIVGGNVKYYHRPAENNGGAVAIDLIKGVTTVSFPAQNSICDGVLGCIMLVDGGLIERYAPDVFDGSLFLCTDESELSIRARRDGYLTLYVTSEVGLHKSGASTGKVSFLSNYYSARNWVMIRMIYSRGWCDLLLVFGYLLLDALKCLVKRRWVYHVGMASGVGAGFSRLIDRRVRAGR